MNNSNINWKEVHQAIKSSTNISDVCEKLSYHFGLPHGFTIRYGLKKDGKIYERFYEIFFKNITLGIVLTDNPQENRYYNHWLNKI